MEFTPKLNRQDLPYVIADEAVDLVNGKWEGYLQHDNVNAKSLEIYPQPGRLGERVLTYTTEIKNGLEWRLWLRVFAAGVERLYLNYESSGDTVEADDVNQLQQAAQNLEAGLLQETALATAHRAARNNPHEVDKAQVGLEYADNTSDADKPVSDAQREALDEVAADAAAALAGHGAREDNPHRVTKTQVGLGRADNTSDVDKPVSTAQQAALDQVAAAADTALNAHAGRTNNPHGVTKAQVGLGNVDNVQQAAKTAFEAHAADAVAHLTAEERTAWNSKETPDGAQSKADRAEERAKAASVPTGRTVNGKALSADLTLTASDVGAAPASHGTHVSYSTSAPVMDGTAAAGSAATVARSDHRHPTDTSRAAVRHVHKTEEIEGLDAALFQDGYNRYTGVTQLADSGSAAGAVHIDAIYGDTVQKAYVATAPECTQVLATGKNLLQITVENQTINGITITNNGNGTVSVRGTAISGGIYVPIGNAALEAGTYRLSGCPAGGSNTKYQLFSGGVSTAYDTGTGVVITASAAGSLNVNIAVYSGNTVDLLLKPMVSAGSSQIAFEPYSGNGVSPSPDYPQTFLPTIKAGVYQVKTHRGVFEVTVPDLYGVEGARDQVVLDPVAGKAWVKSATSVYTFTGKEKFVTDILGDRRLLPFVHHGVLLKSKGLCSHFRQGSPYDTNDCFYTTTIEVEFIAFNVSNKEYPSDDAFRAFLAEQYQANTPVRALYHRKTPVVTAIPCTKISGPDMNIVDIKDMINYVWRTDDTITFKGQGATALNHDWVLTHLKPSTKYTMHYKGVIIDRPAGYGVAYADYIGFSLYNTMETPRNVFTIGKTLAVPVGKELEFSAAFTTPAELHDPGTNYRMISYPEYNKNNSGDAKPSTTRFRDIQIQAVSSATLLNTEWVDFVPSPELPISLESAQDSVELQTIGGSLLPLMSSSTTLGGEITVTDNGDGTVTLNGTATKSYDLFYDKTPYAIFVQPDQTLTAKMEVLGGSSNKTFGVGVYDQNLTKLFSVSTQALVASYAPDREYKLKQFYSWIFSGTVFQNFRFRVMLNFGSEPLPFQVHTGRMDSIPVPQPLRKDDLIREVDGRFQLVQKHTTIQYHGTENVTWVYDAEYKRITSYTDGPPERAKGYGIQMRCSAFQFSKAGSNYYPPHGVFTSNPNIGNLIFGVDPSKVSTVDDWKSFLVSLSAAGTPLTVEYSLAAPVYLDLPDSTQTLLRSILTRPGTTQFCTASAIKPAFDIGIPHGVFADPDKPYLVQSLHSKVDRSVLASGTDLDLVVTSGHYGLSGRHLHLPSGCEYGQLIVSAEGSSVVQYLVAPQSGSLYLRSGGPKRAGGTYPWQDWAQIYSTRNGPSAFTWNQLKGM